MDGRRLLGDGCGQRRIAVIHAVGADRGKEHIVGRRAANGRGVVVIQRGRGGRGSGSSSSSSSGAHKQQALIVVRQVRLIM